MKITSSGQVSIPADIRRRWNVERVAIVDEGERVILVPVPDDPIAAASGAFAGRLRTTTDEMRARAREEDAEIEERKNRLHADR